MVEQWNRDGGTVEKSCKVEHLMVKQWNSGTSNGGIVEHLMV